MKSDILFSVVIPTYNRADLIMETLDSVFKQTYKNYEIIVVDNCSTDNTFDLLMPLANEEKIKYIKHDRNYERSKSRNTGMQYSKGDFLTFLDSDDFMYETCLEDAANYATLHPQVQFFQNLYELVDNNRKKIYSYSFPSLKNQYKAISQGNFISCIGGFIHKDIYKEIRFSEDIKMIGSEDYEVWFHVLAHHKMGRIEKVNSGIRQHPNRSVNHGVYQNLSYQREKLIATLKKDQVLFERFRPYLNLLKGSFLLQEALMLKDLKKRQQSFLKMFYALKLYFPFIFTKRFYSVLYNIIK